MAAISSMGALIATSELWRSVPQPLVNATRMNKGIRSAIMTSLVVVVPEGLSEFPTVEPISGTKSKTRVFVLSCEIRMASSRCWQNLPVSSPTSEAALPEEASWCASGRTHSLVLLTVLKRVSLRQKSRSLNQWDGSQNSAPRRTLHDYSNPTRKFITGSISKSLPQPGHPTPRLAIYKTCQPLSEIVNRMLSF